jgi:hypothetical protein
MAIWYTYCTAIWYILWSFGTFSPVLFCCTKKKSGNPGADAIDPAQLPLLTQPLMDKP